MVERCVRCEVDGRDVRLFDAIYDGRMASICERCSVIENIPVIKKPSSSQLAESEKGVGVQQRMKRMAGVIDSKKNETFFIEDKINELNSNPELELPERDKLNLIEHFHWHIMKHRRKKGLTPEKLAETLGESEVAVQMIEKGKLPENAEVLIRKLEQFFQIRLKKVDEAEMILKERKKQEAVLLDEQGHELEIIPESEFEMINESVEEDKEEVPERQPEVHCKVEVKKDSEVPLLDDEAVVECKVDESVLDDGSKRELDIKQVNPNAVTIADLKELDRKRVEVTRQEQIEEQKKVEERQRMIEARKEELRLLREKESAELSDSFGGMELLGKKDDNFKIEKKEEFDDELV